MGGRGRLVAGADWRKLGDDARERDPALHSSAKGFTIDDIPVEVLNFAMASEIATLCGT